MPVSARTERPASGTDVPDRPRRASTSDLPASAELGRRALAFNVALWTLFGVLQASNWLLSPIADWFPHPERLVATAMVNAYMWALLTPAVFRLAVRVNAERGARARGVALVVVLGLVVGAVTSVVAMGAHHLLLPKPSGVPPASGWTRLWGLSRWYFQEVVTFFVVLVAGVAGDMARRYRAQEREAAQLQAQSAELHAQLAEARLAMLRTRLNPHFLFNTLNAVSALVARDPRGVRDMIALLSELLRHALTDTKEQEISLREELRLLRLYLEILEIRYQGQLRTAVTADPEVQEALVPNLVLQPLVENAMKHGIDRAGGHGTIEVLARRDGDDLVLTVRDTGPGDGAATPRAGQSGMGLRLTRERLAELYGDEQRLELEPVTGGGMTAHVALPYHTSADLRLEALAGV